MFQSLILFLLIVLNDAGECSDNDLLVGYGVCKDDKRDIIFYLDKSCDASVFKLPQPLRDKPCNFVCGTGSFFNYHTGNCEACAPGLTPAGRALVYSNWTTIPSEFIQEHDSRGKPWVAAGYYITTGEQIYMAQTSISIDVNILSSNGTVSFSYEASPDSELSAPLYFFIDGKLPDGQDNSLSARVWDTISFPLSFGTHRLTWKYETSTFHKSSDEGPKIRSIVVTGTHYLNVKCVECKAGEYSINGTCSKCMRGTFSTTPGSVSCEQCPADKTSFPGATSCHDKEPCSEHDYYYNLSDCVAENTTIRTRNYYWIEPLYCNAGHERSVKLPPQQTEECAKCDPGTYRPRGTAECIACPEGTFRSDKPEDNVDDGDDDVEVEEPDETGEDSEDEEVAPDEPDDDNEPEAGKRRGGGRLANRRRRSGEGKKMGRSGRGKRKGRRKGKMSNEDTDDDSKCYKCGAGYHAAFTKYIKHVEKITDVFTSTTCISDSDDLSDCATVGWRAMEDYLDSGNFHSGPVQVVLTMELNHTGTSYIEFEFTTHLLNGSTFKYFTSNGLATVFTAAANEQGIIKKRIDLDQLDTQITWVFHKGWNATAGNTEKRESDFVRIEQIIIHGVEDAQGGATECRMCPAGTHSPSGSKHCLYCGEGHYSPAGSYECLRCDNDSYTSRKGQGECIPCGPNTHASENRRTCEFGDECGFYINETHNFDLSELIEPAGMHGPLFSFDGNTRYFFNLCDKNSSKLLCQDYAGNSVDAYACQMHYTSKPVSLGDKMSFDVFEEEDTYGVKVDFYDGDLCRAQHTTTEGGAETEAERALRRMRTLFSNLTHTATQTHYTKLSPLSFSSSSSSSLAPLLSSLSSSYSANSDQDIPRSATLKLICLPGSGFGMPVLGSPPESPACHFNFEWTTEYACKLCQYNDIVNVTSECRHKRQNVTFHYDKNARCTHGVELPADTVQKCKKVVVGLTFWQGLILLFTILIIIVAAIVFIVTLFRKNRELKYQILQNDNKSALEKPTSMMDEDDNEDRPRPKKKKKKGAKKGKSEFAKRAQGQGEANGSLFSVGDN